jgi:hypothetical protein
MKIGERIAKTLEVMVNEKVNQTLQAIRKEFGKKDIIGPTGPTSTSGEIAEGTLARGQITIEQLVGLAKGAGFSQQDAVIMAAIAMAESGGNSNAHNNNRATGDNSYGLWQINMIDRLGPERLKQFGISNYEQLKDPVINAHAAKKTKERQGFTAWSVYKSGKYKTHLAAAQRAAGSPAITVYKPGTGGGGFIPLGGMVGTLSEVQRLAESMGLTMTSGQRGPRYPGDRSLHISGRAMDFSNVPKGSIGSPLMDKFASEVVKKYGSSLTQLIYTPLGFGIANKKRVNLSHWGEKTNAGHYDHVHVAFEKGGKTPGVPTPAIVGEKGPEFVLDNDTTTALEQNFPGFLDSLNKADYKGTLQVLQNYASYHNPSGTTLMMQRVIIEKPIPMQSKGGGFIPIDNSTSSSNSTAVLYKG